MGRATLYNFIDTVVQHCMKYIVSYRVAADICHWCDLDWLQTLVIAIGNQNLLQKYTVNAQIWKSRNLSGPSRDHNGTTHGSIRTPQAPGFLESFTIGLKNPVLKYRYEKYLKEDCWIQQNQQLSVQYFSILFCFQDIFEHNSSNKVFYEKYLKEDCWIHLE